MGNRKFSDLLAVISATTGEPAGTVGYRARRLRESGQVSSAPDGAATIDDAIVVLIGCMLPGSGAEAERSTPIILQLPLIGCAYSALEKNSQFAWGQALTAESLPGVPQNLFDFLRELLSSWGALDATGYVTVTGFRVGGGVGNRFAEAHFKFIDGDGRDVSGMATFGTGENRAPDDAPLARIDRSAYIPAVIFGKIADFFGAGSEKTAPLDYANIELPV